MSTKTVKFATKRLRMTSKGKILFRPGRQNHFNAKQSGNQNRQKRGFKNLAPAQNKVFREILSR
ncbi:50S ribosomal protein L35 [Patescibacteria group bacterium]|nr:50S ribosomal protein L35 [Patescibacteria group bacterium]MBU2219803.1 50S ribosomal protein L35 [Patescibacteria group bacterium]MBU2265277.1 50S ribosomal protein L35 [Patescibacteria group bacterium]